MLAVDASELIRDQSNPAILELVALLLDEAKIVGEFLRLLKCGEPLHADDIAGVILAGMSGVANYNATDGSFDLRNVASGAYALSVELPNPLIEENGRRRRQLYHKLYADALVHVETPEVLAIPRTAVLMPGELPRQIGLEKMKDLMTFLLLESPPARKK